MDGFRLLFSTVNGIGWGHLTRQVEIASRVRALRPETFLYFMTNAVDLSPLVRADIPYCSMTPEPTQRVTWRITGWEADRKWGQSSSPVGSVEAVLRTLLREVAFDRVIFDTYVSRRSLEIATESDAVPVLFLDNWRGVTTFGETVDAVTERGGFVLVGDGDSRPPRSVESLDDTTHERVFHVGRILRAACAEAECKPTFSDSVSVAVIQGGGGYGEANSRFYQRNCPFLAVATKALIELKHTISHLQANVLLGPYGVWPFGLARPSWISVHQTVRSVPRFLGQRDLVIARGGYNAVCDVISARRPAVFLPIREPTEDQWGHCAKLVSDGAALAVEHDVEALVKALRVLIQDDMVRFRMRDVLVALSSEGGAEAAAARLLAE